MDDAQKEKIIGAAYTRDTCKMPVHSIHGNSTAAFHPEPTELLLFNRSDPVHHLALL